MFTENKRKRK